MRRAWLLAACLLTCVAAFDFGVDSNCGYVSPPASSITRHVDVSYVTAAGTPPLSEEWQPIRIHVHYDPSIDALSVADADLVKNATEAAVAYWSGVLKVRRLTEPLRLARKCDYGWLVSGRMMCLGDCYSGNKCSYVDIPQEHLRPCEHCDRRNGGARDLASCKVNALPWNKKNVKEELEKTAGIPNADFVLYVITAQCPERVLASAAHCQLEATFDRPIAGWARVCAPLPDNSAKKWKDIMTHELAHALAFSKSLFPYYRKDDGTPYIKRDEQGGLASSSLHQVLKTTVTYDWWTVKRKFLHVSSKIITPRVVRETRRHFGCDTLQGMELENEGNEGSAGSHWETRLFRNELMTASLSRISLPVSRVTLALMEDSGWYRVDYKRADLLHWGRNLGCKFAEKSCGEWIKDRRAAGKQPSPFCDQEDMRLKSLNSTLFVKQHKRCSANRESIGGCDLVDRTMHDKPKPKYQYFEHIDGVNDTDVANYGPLHRSLFANDCPFVKDDVDKYCFTADESKTVEYLQEYGTTSRCIDFESRWKKNGKVVAVKSDQHHGGCYKVTCYSNYLYITVAGTAHKCLKTDEAKKIAIETTKDGTSYSGALLCPAYGEVCPKDKYDKDPADTTTTQPTTTTQSTTPSTTNTPTTFAAAVSAKTLDTGVSKKITLPPAAQRSRKLKPTKTVDLFKVSLSFITAIFKLF